MKNVLYEVRGDILIINVDLSKRVGPSATGRTKIVGSTQGAIRLTSHPGIRFSFVAYAKEKK